MLETKHLTKEFGGLVAVDDVSMSVDDGELRAIIGPNGAGKTTLLNLLTGLLTPTKGEILLRGEPITDLDPETRVARGIGRSFQITNIFPELSVRKNIRIAVQREAGLGWNFWSNTDSMTDLNDRVDEIIEEVGITVDPDTTAAATSHGEKRLLELAIVIAQDPDVLLLDEPAAGMSAEETRELVELIRRLNESYTIVLIEHDIDLIMELSDRITVLVEGSIIAEGRPADVSADDRVQEAYLGGEI
jgi:branched-chain amino acid transport system ATP-binding protein